MQTLHALSIVAPNGSRICTGEKTIEVRSWLPGIPFGKDILIVENQTFLTERDDQEAGMAVPVVKVKAVREFLRSDIKAACASYWDEGYYSWLLEDIRKISNPFHVTAKRGLYPVQVDSSKL